MRFEVRFGNGAWRVFDTVEYTTARLCGRRVDAIEEAAHANAGDLLRRARRK